MEFTALAFLIFLLRIFEVGMRVFSDGIEGEFRSSGGMGFVDFIYFMLSEEDKTTDTSLAYWYPKSLALDMFQV